MSVPWVSGTVEAVRADLRKSIEQNPGCNGIEYAAAIGMIVGLVTEDGYPLRPQRSLTDRMADIRTVCEAVRSLEETP